MIEMLVGTNEKMYQVPVEGSIKWTTSRKGTPGQLTFTTYGISDIEEGNSVNFRKDGQNVFFGFIFDISSDKSKKINITAYDQLRYLKNKDTYKYTKTASDLITTICNDFNMQTGIIADTGYIVKRTESNKTLFDIIQTALDWTLVNTGKLYTLYDDFGKVTLKSIEDMGLDLLLDEETGENYNWSSSINDSYNKIKIVKNKEAFITQHSENINKWGVLQYYEEIQEENNNDSNNPNIENPQIKSETLLKLYNSKKRSCRLKKQFGDIRVRAGSRLYVRLDLVLDKINSMMLVDKVTHTFENGLHTMDVELRGGNYA